jgi:hypothetical protein
MAIAILNNKKRIKKIVLNTLKYIIYAAVVYFIYIKLDRNVREISDLNSIDFRWLFLALFIFSFNSIWNGFNWHYLITSSGEDVTRMSQMEVYLKSYLLRYIPGNVVGILARAVYNKPYGVPMVKSLWGWFFENIVYLTIGLVIGSYALSVAALDFNIPGSQTVIIGAVFVGVLIILKNDWLDVVFNKFLVPKLPEGAKDDIVSLNIKLRERIILAVRYLGAWGIYSLSFIAIMKSVGVDTTSEYILGISINALAWSIGYLTLITPSGTGVRETIMIFMFENAVGLSSETSVIIALSARVVFIVGELLGFVEFYAYKFLLKFVRKYRER